MARLALKAPKGFLLIMIVVAVGLALPACDSCMKALDEAGKSAEAERKQKEIAAAKARHKAEQAAKKAAPPAPKPKPRVPPPIKPRGTMLALQDYIAGRDESLTYAHLKKNADRHKGQVMWLRGQIMTIREEGKVTQIQLQTKHRGYGIWSDQVMVFYAGLTPFVEKKVIRVAGKVLGDYSYTSRAGWKMSVPAVKADFVVSGKRAFRAYLKDFKKLRKAKGKNPIWDCYIENLDNTFDPQKLKWAANLAAARLLLRCMDGLQTKDLTETCSAPKKILRKCGRLFRGMVDASVCREWTGDIKKACCSKKLITGKGCK